MMMKYCSFIDIVDACNTVYDDDAPPEISRNKTVAISELTLLVLHDTKGKLRTFGYLTKAAVEGLPWTKYGFVLKGKRLTHPIIEPAHVRSMQLSTKFEHLVMDPMSKKNFPILRYYENELVTVYGHEGHGGPGFVIPEPLSFILGVARIVVHLTAYTESKEGLKIWVQVRPGEAGLHRGLLDQTASKAFLHNDYNQHPLYRVASQEIHFIDEREEKDKQLMDSLKVADSAEIHRCVSHFGIRDEQSGPLEGLVDAAVRASFSIKLHEKVIPRAPKWLPSPGDYELLTVPEVKLSLLAGDWSPCSALVMIHFLVEHKQISEDEPGYAELVGKLHRNLPHARDVLKEE